MINATDEDKEALAEIQKDKSKIQMDRNQVNQTHNYEPETYETQQNFEVQENQEDITKASSKNNNENFDNQTDQSEKRTSVMKPENVMTESRNENVSFWNFKVDPPDAPILTVVHSSRSLSSLSWILF